MERGNQDDIEDAAELLAMKIEDDLQLQAEFNRLTAELTECRKILEKQLDRDKDPNDSLRDLVVVACNALYYARAKKEHFVMAKLKAELDDKNKEIELLKTCSGQANPNICQVCGEKLSPGMSHSCM